jgi:ring-1,2-phenylacetyl-CoA epoxidase subunit PaaD
MDGPNVPGVGMVTPVATDLHSVVAAVVDPEIPVLTIEDLGVLRSVETSGDHVVVTITPTYSGCPAMRQIEDDIVAALQREGVNDCVVKVSHSPPWTTNWISDEGHRKLAEFGIAPPTGVSEVRCPQCRAEHPEMIARFGSTACKALMVCTSCGEPFDYFKEF